MPGAADSCIALDQQYGNVDSATCDPWGAGGGCPGAMNEAKWQGIFDGAVADGLYPASLDWKTKRGFTGPRS